jgi:hypothetical protein
MPATFDPDDFELRWPPQLFIDGAKRLRSRKGSSDWMSDVEWLLTDAFVSTEPAEVFSHLSSGGSRSTTRNTSSGSLN